MRDAGGGVAGEAADVQFVDDEFGDRQVEGAVVFPVEIIFRQAAAVREDVGLARRVAENPASADGPGERIEKNVPFVEAVSGVRIERTVHAVAVFDAVRVDIEYDHGKDITDAEFRGERNLGEGAQGSFLEEHEGAAGGVARENGEVDAARHDAGTEGQRMPVTQTEDPVVVGGRMFPCGFRHADLSAGAGYFHLMLQPMLGCCGAGAGEPLSTASSAARRSSPVQGMLLPGVLASKRPW